MNQSQLLAELANRIVRIELPHPTRVAIDGVDAARKTTLAQALAAQLKDYGRPIIRASIDGFHNPARIRHRQGSTSPEGYFNDSFDYQRLIDSLLAPLGPGQSRRYISAVFDYRIDNEAQIPMQVAPLDAILLFDGVFLLRSELIEFWDFTIYVEASFETTLARAERRDAVLFGGVEEVRKRHEQRYIPGQKLYLEKCRPKERANVVVDNNDPLNPNMI